MLKSTCRGLSELGKEAKFSGDKFQGCIGDDSIVDWFGLRARLTKTDKLESESEFPLKMVSLKNEEKSHLPIRT